MMRVLWWGLAALLISQTIQAQEVNLSEYPMVRVTPEKSVFHFLPPSMSTVMGQHVLTGAIVRKKASEDNAEAVVWSLGEQRFLVGVGYQHDEHGCWNSQTKRAGENCFFVALTYQPDAEKPTQSTTCTTDVITSVGNTLASDHIRQGLFNTHDTKCLSTSAASNMWLLPVEASLSYAQYHYRQPPISAKAIEQYLEGFDGDDFAVEAVASEVFHYTNVDVCRSSAPCIEGYFILTQERGVCAVAASSAEEAGIQTTCTGEVFYP